MEDYGDDANFNQDKVWKNHVQGNIHNWFAIYKRYEFKYSKFINMLIKIYSEESKYWHVEKRVKWVNKIKSNENKCKLDNIANFEYFPFHTNNASEIKPYWVDKDSHYECLLRPAVYLCQQVESKELNNKIISRGNWQNGWRRYFEQLKREYNWILDEKRIIVYPRFGVSVAEKGYSPYILNICFKKDKKNTVYFLNFDGGGAAAQAMSLPSIGTEDSVCLIEFYGDKYISVYFDEFMRKIDKYIY